MDGEGNLKDPHVYNFPVALEQLDCILGLAKDGLFEEMLLLTIFSVKDIYDPRDQTNPLRQYFRCPEVHRIF